MKIGNLIDYFSNLVEFKFEENSRITSIGEYFLQHCPKLETFTLPSSLSSLGKNIGYISSLKIYKILWGNRFFQFARCIYKRQ